MKSKVARRGEIWTIRDNKTRGHKTFIIRGNRYRNNVLHLPFTHKNKTRNMHNIKLNANPEFDKYEDSYILPKVQKSKEKNLGHKINNFQIKNTNDKKLVRHIIKKSKKNKRQ